MIICYHLLPALDPTKPREINKKVILQDKQQVFCKSPTANSQISSPGQDLIFFAYRSIFSARALVNSRPRNFFPRPRQNITTKVDRRNFNKHHLSWVTARVKILKCHAAAGQWRVTDHGPGKQLGVIRVRLSPLVCFVEFKPPLMRC